MFKEQLHLLTGDPVMFRELLPKYGLNAYPTDGGEFYLKQAIAAFHRYYHHAMWVEPKHICLTVGSTQALNFVIQNLLGDEISTCPGFIYYKIPELIKMAGKKHITSQDPDLIIYPNNPTGALPPVTNNTRVVDCAYNWPHYFYGVEKPLRPQPNDKAYLFSYAKITGDAGARLGWILTSDTDTIKKAEWWTELQTNGVSVDSQFKALQLLSDFETMNFFFHAAKTAMKERKKLLGADLFPGPFALISQEKAKEMNIKGKPMTDGTIRVHTYWSKYI